MNNCVGKTRTTHTYNPHITYEEPENAIEALYQLSYDPETT
jgi:hypothetical protein